jgi:aryl-alcohol dehydrogenase-like predicted oxidoreductase
VIGDPRPQNFEGLSAPVVRKATQDSLRRLGRENVGLLYAHYDDRNTPLEETVAAFAELAEQGAATVLGASNQATWRIEQARRIAQDHAWPGYSCVQQAGSYLWPHPAPGQLHVITDELLDYTQQKPEITVMAYTPLLAGGYADRTRALPGNYPHASSLARLAVLDEVAAELGATAGQVVLSWLMNGPVPIIPIVGTSSVAQLEEAVGAVELEIPAQLRTRLDEAH